MKLMELVRLMVREVMKYHKVDTKAIADHSQIASEHSKSKL